MRTNNVVLGFSAMVTAATFSRLLLQNLNGAMDLEFRLILSFFVGAVVGALVAREKFLLPALGAWLFFWCCYMGIALSNGQPVLAATSRNFDTIALSAGAVISGVLLVQSLLVIVRSSFRAT
jgi:hypothetical protein